MDGKNTTSESAYLQVNYFLECADGYQFIMGACVPDICITDPVLNVVCYDDFETYYCHNTYGCIENPQPQEEVVDQDYWRTPKWYICWILIALLSLAILGMTLTICKKKHDYKKKAVENYKKKMMDEYKDKRESY